MRSHRVYHMEFTVVYNLLAGRRRLQFYRCFHRRRQHRASQRPYLNTHVQYTMLSFSHYLTCLSADLLKLNVCWTCF